MVIIKQCAVPFNTRAKRFGVITCHPKLDPSGLYTTRPDACDPCLYRPIIISDLCAIVHSRVDNKNTWTYERELEEWAQNLGYRNQRVLEQRKWNRSLLGPAWHSVAEPAKYNSACPNVGFGRTSRTVRSKNNLPGPGTYYKEKPYKVPYGPHSNSPTFEREEPCRFKDTVPNWSLAPDRYRLIDKDAIAEKSNKIVSLRGPYDLSTGKRDGHTIKNHFSTSGRCYSTTWPLALKGSLDKYSKSRFGEMNKTNMETPFRGRSALVELSLCVRNPEDPGPSHYEVYKPRVFKRYKCGFNSSYDKPPGYKRAMVWPGVGRYSIATEFPIKGEGHQHVFMSKIKRTIGANLPQPMNNF